MLFWITIKLHKKFPKSVRLFSGASYLFGGLGCRKGDGLWFKSERHTALQLSASQAR